MKEIITLQLGNLSNYVATHFWNTQESYFTYESEAESSPSSSWPSVCHDVHWRAGVASDGSDTFLPRTVIYDLKGGFGTLRKINALYESTSVQQLDDDAYNSNIWTRLPVEHRLPRVARNSYQQSLDAGETPGRLGEADVRYWSDFSRVFFHPRSAVQLQDYELGSAAAPFDSWQAGADLYRSLERDEDLVDRDLRPFVEEADQPQGIQLVTTTQDSWGAFAVAYLERLRDEFGKACIWAWAVQDAPRPDSSSSSAAHRRLRLHNVAKSFLGLSDLASAIVPLSAPQGGLPASISLALSSPWQVSALLATGMESAALSSRINVDPSSGTADTLGDLVDTLNVRGNQKMIKLGLGVLPTQQPSLNGVTIQGGAVAHKHLMMNLSCYPGALDGPKSPKYRFGQVETTRGTLSISPSTLPPGQGGIAIPFPILDSFPNIYSALHESLANTSVNVRTTLQTDSSIAGDIDALRKTTSRFVSVEEREVLMDGLSTMADAYKDGWSSGSDDDEDM